MLELWKGEWQPLVTLYTVSCDSKVMLWSPSPELARVVIPFTVDGGPVASLDARQTNFNAHVEFLLALDFPFFSLCCLCPNSLRRSKGKLGEAVPAFTI